MKKAAKEAGRAGVDWMTWTASEAVQAAVDAWAGDLPTDEWEAAYCEGVVERRIEAGDPIRWTTAPRDYDMTGFGTVELEVCGEFYGKPLRRVLLDPHHADYQEGCYGSGVHPVWAEDPRIVEARARERVERERIESATREARRAEGLAWLAARTDAEVEALSEDGDDALRGLTCRDVRAEQAKRAAARANKARSEKWSACRALVPEGCVLVDDGDPGGYDKVGGYTFRRPPYDSAVYYDVYVLGDEDADRAAVRGHGERGNFCRSLADVAEMVWTGRLRVARPEDVPPRPVLDRIGHSQLKEVRKVVVAAPGEVLARTVWVGRRRYMSELLVLDERGRLVRARAVVAAVLAQEATRLS